MSKSARQISAEILQKMEARGAYSNLSLAAALKKDPPADPRDAALTSLLVYGVTERKLTLDYNLRLYLKQPLKKLPPPVLQALRLGAYQIFYAEKIPVSAAVNESVKLVRSGGFSYAAGLVNAVLRKLAAAGIRYPARENEAEYLSVRYSAPEPLIRRFCGVYGAETTENIFAAFFEKRPVYIRLNSLKATAEELCASLEKDGVKPVETELPGAFILEHSGDISLLSAFREGWFYVQDLSSQRCASVLGALPGETVADCCAAPGGKSFAAAIRMQNKGRLIACDLHPHKTDLIEAGAARLGITCLETVCGDARRLPALLQNGGLPFAADRVLCDVPCSGFGILGRKPEIRYKSPEDVAGLPALQYEILSACAGMVKPGGVLQYSTCTLLPEENGEVCDRFLAEHPDFCPAEDDAYRAICGGERFSLILPAAGGGDGFFIAKMIRKN